MPIPAPIKGDAVTTQAPTIKPTTELTIEQRLALQEALDTHNRVRSMHCFTPDLELDLEMSKVAQKIADRKVLSHSEEEDRNFYGENIAWVPRNTDEGIGEAIKEAVREAVYELYDENYHYNYGQPSSVGRNGKTVEHFTQVIYHRTDLKDHYHKMFRWSGKAPRNSGLGLVEWKSKGPRAGLWCFIMIRLEIL